MNTYSNILKLSDCKILCLIVIFQICLALGNIVFIEVKFNLCVILICLFLKFTHEVTLIITLDLLCFFLIIFIYILKSTCFLFALRLFQWYLQFNKFIVHLKPNNFKLFDFNVKVG